MQQEADTLVLCRTPFQAVIVREVLKNGSNPYYDLVYLTQDDSEEDSHYFNELSFGANLTQYIYLKRQRYDILNYIMVYQMVREEIKCQDYKTVMIASVNNLAFRKLAAKNGQAKIISFDDGAAHIVKNSMYLNDKQNLRARLYEAFFLVPSLRMIRGRINLHYSAYPGFDHVMPQKIVRFINPFKTYQANNNELGPAFFIGQPFEEYLDAMDTQRIEKFIREHNIDFYVRHPRESQPLVTDIPVLPKAGRIAEEAIFAASKGRRPLIYGGFSTVLINIRPAYADKVMLLRSNVPEDAYYAELGIKAGCQIVYL